MRGAVTTLEMVLIFLIGIALAGTAISFASGSFGSSLDSAEVKNVKAELESCGSKILSTARTGSSSVCFFSGIVSAQKDGLYYSKGNKKLCTPSDWSNIGSLWQSCGANYNLKWNATNITFNTRGLEGKTLNANLGELTKTGAILNITIG